MHMLTSDEQPGFDRKIMSWALLNVGTMHPTPTHTRPLNARFDNRTWPPSPRTGRCESGEISILSNRVLPARNRSVGPWRAPPPTHTPDEACTTSVRLVVCILRTISRLRVKYFCVPILLTFLSSRQNVKKQAVIRSTNSAVNHLYYVQGLS
jgi:hypothetical protein